MQLKCNGTSVAEVPVAGGQKVPMFTATLVGDEEGAKPFRIIGPAGSPAASMSYGKTYELAEVEAPAAD